MGFLFLFEIFFWIHMNECMNMFPGFNNINNWSQYMSMRNFEWYVKVILTLSTNMGFSQ
jgi:hypothetical protein